LLSRSELVCVVTVQVAATQDRTKAPARSVAWWALEVGEGAATLVGARKITITIAWGRCFAAARATATFKNVVAAALLPWGHDTTAGEVVVAAPASVQHDILLDDVTCAPAVLAVVADLANL